MAVSAPDALWSAFTGRAELLGAAVFRTASEESAGNLISEATSRFVCTTSAARRFPRIATRSTGTQSQQGQPPELEVVAPGEFAVAETGSVALNEPQTDRGRCFLAERLWLLVRASDMVPTLEEAMQRLRDLVASGATHPLLMSGPSRTADIERVLTVGVHGPRAVVIMVLDEV